MKQTEFERLRSAFLKAFASVPSSLREQIILAVDGKPFTWDSIFVEVKEGTGRSKRMLEELKKLEIID